MAIEPVLNVADRGVVASRLSRPTWLGGDPVLDLAIDELIAVDQAHLIHPLHSPAAHAGNGPVILVSGQGAVLRDVHGKEYLDGLSQLWNVNVGHGRRELAEAAAEQISQIAFVSNYTGQASLPT